jgi:metal-dependent HD superfamily phosphatase/phosphodiesterase
MARLEGSMDEPKVYPVRLISLNLPVRHNERLRQVQERISRDVEMQTLWRCANVNAVERAHITDHGPVHIRIVANIALKLLRLLVEGGVVPNVVADHGLTLEDAEVVVVLATALHDVGIAVHRDDHESHSVILADRLVGRFLQGIYPPTEATVLAAEILHAVAAHRRDQRCLTVEAGVVKVADALDMTEGRSRIPFEAGELNIHSVSAQAVDAVHLRKGKTKPVRLEIVLSNSAGIFQVDELLRGKLHRSSIASYIEVVAHIEGEQEKRIVTLYEAG